MLPKNLIVYFSGTGNSLAVSRLLADHLEDTLILPALTLLHRSDYKINADTCGFIFPVYCQDAPEIMKRLVSRVRIAPQTHVYGLATHNGDVGYAHFSLNRILQKAGQRLQAGFAVLMPGNSITPYNYTNPDNEQQRRIHAARSAVQDIAPYITAKSNRPFEGTDSLRKHFRGLRNLFRHRVVHKIPDKFWFTDACDRCSLCARICPENNIRVDLTNVKWGKHCQMCLACIHWCPRQAIQNGSGTVNLKRYHHPDIAISDMIYRK